MTARHEWLVWLLALTFLGLAETFMGHPTDNDIAQHLEAELEMCRASLEGCAQPWGGRP